MTDPPVPLVDLGWQHRQIEADLMPELLAAMRASEFVLGQRVRTFEEAFASASGVRWCRGVASGTDAIELALRGAGIGAGDEVIVPANSFVASAAAVVRAGATPRLIDCDPCYHLLDPALIEQVSTSRTRAVLAVHLFGQLAPMAAIAAQARPLGLLVFEDAAQAHGARQLGRSMGQYGMAAATSFYPGKNLGAYGDAGAVLTDDDAIAARVARLRDHGSSDKYRHELLGVNSRLDALQAVVLLAKLERLPEWNRLRVDAAQRYHDLLEGVGAVSRPLVMAGNSHVWHLYVVRVPDRDRVAQRMREQGVQVGMHYPLPLHRQPALGHLGYGPGAFPEAERAAAEVLSLPLYPGITAAQQERVTAALRTALGGRPA